MKIAFCTHNNANLADKAVLRAVWRNSRTKLNNATSNLERKRLKERVQQLEVLRSPRPREFWKGLYDLDNTNFDDSKIPLLVKNSENQLVGGLEASKVWMESFAKLGREQADFDDYDSAFYKQIKGVIPGFERDSLDIKFELDYPISLEEVRLVVKKLRNGKAVGLDGIFNEVFKFGGDQVLIIFGNYTRLCGPMNNSLWNGLAV